jgi:Flp pilus assembly pilin Flp
VTDAITAIALRPKNAVSSMREREEGQGLVEYVVLVALIAIGVIVAVSFFRDQIGDVFSEIGNRVEDELP